MKKILDKRINKGQIGIRWLGQSGFLLKTQDNKIIIIDPYLSNSVEKKSGLKRLVPIPLNPEDAEADMVLCTHDHLDHTDPDTLPKMKKIKKFVGSAFSCRHFKALGIDDSKIIEIKRNREKIIEGIKILPVYARHTDDSVGYVLSACNVTIYITGDSEYDEELKKNAKYNPNILIICINGKYGNMNIKEAAMLTKCLKPNIVIPTHYGMFEENTVEPKEFLHVVEKTGIETMVKILDFNKYYIF